MQVDKLALEDFRNYEMESVEFAPGLNLVVGRNAQGKTNLLEAVYYLSGLGSPRQPDPVLVREGADRALLHADVVRATRRLRIDIEIKSGRGTRALLNGTPLPALRALGEAYVCVFFGPDELALIKGPPEGRRRFLDDLVVKLRPARDSLRRDLERILKQRNALLKSAPRSGGGDFVRTLDTWDESLTRAGAALARARLESLSSLAPYVQKRYEATAGGGRVELGYASSWLPEEMMAAALGEGRAEESMLAAALQDKLTRIRDREIERGMTLAGPQRDDLVVNLQSAGDATRGLLDARLFASQGDQRTIALALKLGETDLLSAVLGEEPVLLLDDVFSELDPQRRQWLADAVRAGAQTLLSSAEPGAIESANADRIIEVTEGRLRVA